MGPTASIVSLVAPTFEGEVFRKLMAAAPALLAAARAAYAVLHKGDHAPTVGVLLADAIDKADGRGGQHATDDGPYSRSDADWDRGAEPFAGKTIDAWLP